MRFVTFDAGGHRRLGALLGERVVDLPGLVGHPAFPASMEALVRRNGGTLLAAAERALERPDAVDAVVDEPRLLAPVIPASLRSADVDDGRRPIVGPEASISWPAGARFLEPRVRLVAVLRRGLHDARPAEAQDAIFGYTLLVEWRAGDAAGDADALPLPLALGPCLAMRADLEPASAVLEIRVDGRQWRREPVGDALVALARDIAAASRLGPLEAGEAFASSTLAPGRMDILPGASVEVTIEGIGTLEMRVGRAA